MKSVYLRKGRLFSVVLSLFLVIIVFPCYFNRALAAQTEETATVMTAEAKKEGKLTWYTALTFDVANGIKNKFHEKYPFIDMAIFRSGSENILIKILIEAQSKKHVFDIVTAPGAVVITLKNKGYLSKYLSSQSKFWPDGYKDQEGYWTDFYSTYDVIAYNKQLVSPKVVPRMWNDLLAPRWQGKIGMTTSAYEWVGYMLKHMGEKKGLEYLENLSKQKIQFRPGKTLLAQLMSAGELSLVLVNSAVIELLKDKGAPVEWGIEPIIPTLHPVGISANSPHPNAAKLFTDFILTREIQEMEAAANYRSSTRIDVKQSGLRKDVKIFTPDFAIIDNYQNLSKIYRDVVMKKK